MWRVWATGEPPNAFLSVADTGQDAALLRNELAKLGWVEGRNLQLDFRYGAGNSDRIRDFAAELVNLRHDVIVAFAPIRAAQERTQTIPIGFIGGCDVYAAGQVKNLARPDGNITGIANLFGSIGGKWLELLKEAAPTVERVAYLVGVSPESLISPEYYFPQIQEAARVLGVKVLEIRYRRSVDLVRAIDAFAAAQNSGLIVGPASLPTPEGVFAAAAAVLDACHRSLLVFTLHPRFHGL